MLFTTEFLADSLPLDWADVLWGYRHQHIGWRVPIQIAEAKGVAQTPLETELAQIGKDQDWRVGQIVEEVSQRKWLYLSLLWLYETRESIDNPLGQVGEVYADFDYPDEIASFVGYMPPEDGFDPKTHTLEECLDRLFANWKQYLDTA